MKRQTIFIDIDETIFITPKEEPRDYTKSKPIVENIAKANKLYDQGHQVVYWTARGSRSGIDWHDLTKDQLDKYSVKYHSLRCDKPYYDLFIDDKALNVVDWEKKSQKRRGVIAGAFDILHPGYIYSFEKAKKKCEYLVVALHVDPSVETENKKVPIFSTPERKKALLALKYVDEVITYKTESDLYEILRDGNFSIRFLGDDYVGKTYTASDLEMPVVYLSRTHGWSYTKILNIIKERQ